MWLFLVLPLLPWERRLAQRWHYEHLDTWSVTLLYWQWIFSVSLLNALLPYLTISVRKNHVFSKMKSALTSVLHLILLTHITPPFILILVLILKEFLSVICIQGCNSLSRQFIYLETQFLFLYIPDLCCHELSFSFFAFYQLRYGEPTLRRAVPLALALISVSNPRLNILDTLSKFSHDADPEVSHNSIFAMGMVGSGKFRNNMKSWKLTMVAIIQYCAKLLSRPSFLDISLPKKLVIFLNDLEQ